MSAPAVTRERPRQNVIAGDDESLRRYALNIWRTRTNPNTQNLAGFLLDALDTIRDLEARVSELETPTYLAAEDSEGSYPADDLTALAEDAGIDNGGVARVFAYHELPARWLAVVPVADGPDAVKPITFATEVEARAAVAKDGAA
jgi:hypothetical protein